MENKTETPITTQQRTFPANVAQIINDYQLAINRGSLHGIKQGQRLLIYRLSSEEIKDPQTGESLGYLEIVKGTGKVINVQETLSTVESDKKQFNRRRLSDPWRARFGFRDDIVESEDLVPFDEPQVGDMVKPI